jgi:outer membrane protein OmpA-like peptidoglycan-associated protein
LKIHFLAILLPCALLLLAAGCAGKTQRTVVIVLPDDQGSVGKVEVSTAAGTRVLDEAGEATVVESPDSLPEEPFLMEEEEIRSLFGPALEAQPRKPATFTLYFRKDSTGLTEESLALMAGIVEEAGARRSADVSVVGHTDRVGDEEYNLDLSTKRAEAVRDLLVTGGIDPSILHATSHGEDNPLVPTEDEVPEPLNRRVEVTVR